MELDESRFGPYNEVMFVQYVLIGVIVGGAMVYLIRRLWRSVASGKGVAGCGSCGCGGSGDGGADRLGKRQELIDVQTPRRQDGG